MRAIGENLRGQQPVRAGAEDRRLGSWPSGSRAGNRPRVWADPTVSRLIACLRKALAPLRVGT